MEQGRNVIDRGHFHDTGAKFYVDQHLICGINLTAELSKDLLETTNKNKSFTFNEKTVIYSDYEYQAKGDAQGIATILYNDGTIYRGQCANNNPHGVGILMFANGTGYKGKFENGEKTKVGWDLDLSAVIDIKVNVNASVVSEEGINTRSSGWVTLDW
jgi:hypothetical protein